MTRKWGLGAGTWVSVATRFEYFHKLLSSCARDYPMVARDHPIVADGQLFLDLAIFMKSSHLREDSAAT